MECTYIVSNPNHAWAHQYRFLLAKLYMDAIQDKVTSNSIKKAISEFGTNPDAYSEAYDAAIERIESQKSDRLTYAKRLLSWVSLAKRELSVSELEHALAAEPSARAIDKGDIPDLQDVISFCAGLVSIDQASRVVKLVHLTAQTFLEKKRAEFLPNAESNIARTCITYQCFDAFASGHCATDQEYEERIQNYPLYRYAAHYWSQHTRDSRQFNYALLLLKQTAHIQGPFQALSIRENVVGWEGYTQSLTQDIVALHLLAYLGLGELVGEIAEAEIDAEASNGQTPLWIAAAQGHEAVARLLIDHGARVDHSIRDDVGLGPLLSVRHRAQEGDVIMRLLAGQWTELPAAVRRGRDAVMSCQGPTPLFVAASKGYERVVKLLIKNGASIDKTGFNKPTPLLEAAGQGYTAIVKLLIENGASINKSDWHDQIPLLYTARKGYTATVKLLIEYGASIEKLEENGQALLTAVASRGYIAVVKLLIENGVSINEYGHSIQTPLTAAASRGHATVVKLLIENGASINKANKNCETPLAVATSQGHKAVERLLVKYGATVQYGWPPLLAGVGYGLILSKHE